MSEKRYAGSCLCRAVRFEVEGEFQHFYLCHCGNCRKDTGSAHAANLFSTTASVRWVCGEEQVRRFDLPGTRHCKSFCGTCGSALPTVPMTGRLLVVPAGSLDSPLEVSPDAHVFTSDRAGWDRDLEQAPAYERLPSGP